MSKVIKVLIVDDSAFMRKIIEDILNHDPDIAVVGKARNGEEALQKAQELKPDVITLDIEMPVMSGLECLEKLLQSHFIPVIMLSSLTKRGADVTIRALEVGAVDFLAKPTNIFEMKRGGNIHHELIQKIKVASTSSRIKKPVLMELPPREKGVETQGTCIRNIVAIGTSTGGPRALQGVIPLIPADVPATFVVVQHMPAGFTKSLADRLNNMSQVTVKEAEDGEFLKEGFVYIAPGNYHMKIRRSEPEAFKIQLTQEAPVGAHRPSVDVMMQSLSKTSFKNVVAVIMTGMGGDGSEGIKKVKTSNDGYIIAQDEESSTVYGMPKMAVQTGMVDAQVPLNEITQEIMKNLGVHR